MIVVALLISWTLRGDGGESKEAKARNLAALALGLLIAVYLYAHTVSPHQLKSELILATTVYEITSSEDVESYRGACEE